MQTERGFVLHEAVVAEGQRTDESVYASTMTIPGGLEMTTSKDVLEALSTGAGPRKVLITLGYAAWGEGQLESELAENSWLTVGADIAVIFDTPVEQRYDRALKLLGLGSLDAVTRGGARLRWTQPPWPTVPPHLQSFLAFDFGLKRTGVASGNRLLKAMPSRAAPSRPKAMPAGRWSRKNQRVAARRAGGGRALPPRRRQPRKYARGAEVRAPAARPLTNCRCSRWTSATPPPRRWRSGAKDADAAAACHHPGTVFEEPEVSTGWYWMPRPCTLNRIPPAARRAAPCVPANEARLVGITSGGAWLAARCRTTWA
jgi:hypothetical protein